MPQSYQEFLKEYGIGVYSDLLIIEPDDQRLKAFTPFDFWDFDESIPIKKEQLEECIVLMESVYGDIFAIHPEVNQLLLFPRHSEEISLCVMDEKDFFKTLNTAISHIFSGPFPPAFLLEDEDSDYDEYFCQVFRKQFGGYVRFSSKSYEVAVFYDEDKSQQVEATFQFSGKYVS